MKYIVAAIVSTSSLALIVGPDYAAFFQLDSLVFILLFLLSYSVACFGKRCFTAMLDPSNSGGFMTVAVFSGVIGAIIGLVLMLRRLNDLSALGAGMAVCLLSPLYGMILSIGFLVVGNSNSDKAVLSASQKAAVGSALLILAITQASFCILLSVLTPVLNHG